MLHWSACPSPAPFFPYLWTRPRILKPSHLRQHLTLNPDGTFHLFPTETMVSNLEVLILIPIASNSAVKWSKENWWSRFYEANRTTSPAKSTNGIPWPPNRTPSTPWLCLEIISIKVMKRICDKGQPYRVPLSPKMNLTYYWQRGPNCHFVCLETE